MNIHQFWSDVPAQRADNGKASAWRQDMSIEKKMNIEAPRITIQSKNLKQTYRNSVMHTISGEFLYCISILNMV